MNREFDNLACGGNLSACVCSMDPHCSVLQELGFTAGGALPIMASTDEKHLMYEVYPHGSQPDGASVTTNWPVRRSGAILAL